jgi:hypothetical protein
MGTREPEMKPPDADFLTGEK